MGSYTTPHHPIYTYGSPATKLSTYCTIYEMCAVIIKLVKKQIKWQIQEDGQSNQAAGFISIQMVPYTAQTSTLPIE